MNEKSMKIYEEFLDVIREIREKCPWDSVQTHESLKTYFQDETEEVLEGIDIFTGSGDSTNLCEELGDLLMLIVLESRIAEEEGLFTLDDVITGISAKMKYRHPKIFSPEDQEAAQLSWDELKKREKELRISSGNKPSDLA
ncbi:MazG nucleotide pyrophosphohydrolase domain-containing protein [Blautia sp. HCP3S3_G3]|uniref:MazG nucleotide pyrophosphohydrolase domain-containing protein n=1 Tax=Blautia sp. HCP3S3_G3 TaxID=3438913 RepID=UPI003F89671A